MPDVQLGEKVTCPACQRPGVALFKSGYTPDIIRMESHPAGLPQRRYGVLRENDPCRFGNSPYPIDPNECLCQDGGQHSEKHAPGRQCGRCRKNRSGVQICGRCGRGIYRIGGWAGPNYCTGCGRFVVPRNPSHGRGPQTICQCPPVAGFKPRKIPQKRMYRSRLAQWEEGGRSDA